MKVKRRRLELPRHNCHYPLKVARLPIPPSLRMMQKTFSVPRTGLEPARLSTLAPETSASTIPPPGQKMFLNILSGKRDSNSRPRPWQGRALPTELFPQKMLVPLSSLAFAFPWMRLQRYNYFFKAQASVWKKINRYFIFSVFNTSCPDSRCNWNAGNIPKSRRYAASRCPDGGCRWTYWFLP